MAEGESGAPRNSLLPQLRMDELLDELISRMTQIRATRDRVQQLLQGVLAVSGGLELDQVLSTIIGTATELVDARYGALGVIDGGDPLYRAELDVFRRLGARRAISVPLRARHEVLGMLTLVRTGPEDLDERDRLPLIEDLAHRIAITVDNARLHATAAQTAEHLQRCLLPELPRAGPLELAARYEPAQATAEIGGDWYDAFLLPVGDAEGDHRRRHRPRPHRGGPDARCATCCGVSPATARSLRGRSSGYASMPRERFFTRSNY